MSLSLMVLLCFIISVDDDSTELDAADINIINSRDFLQSVVTAVSGSSTIPLQHYLKSHGQQPIEQHTRAQVSHVDGSDNTGEEGVLDILVSTGNQVCKSDKHNHQ